MKFYVASSWRNNLQPGIVHIVRQAGHEAYDFKNPAEGSVGFHWSEISEKWKYWGPREFCDALQHPISQAGFTSDFDAMEWADAGLLVLPCGRSAHLEAGYFVGAKKPLYILMLEQQEPELMYLMATKVLTSMDELFDVLGVPASSAA